jgi:hypothetical protein
VSQVSGEQMAAIADAFDKLPAAAQTAAKGSTNAPVNTP